MTTAYTDEYAYETEIRTDPDEPTIHAARISFYSREGYCLQDKAFVTEEDAAEWFSTLHMSGATDLPPGWYAATLQHFDHLLPVVVDTIYSDTPRCICCMDNGCPLCTVSLLSLVRQLRDALRVYDAALHACDNHYQAGYDTGYEQQYQQESDALRANWIAASDEVDRLELLIFSRLEQPNNSLQWLDHDRACRIARHYA